MSIDANRTLWRSVPEQIINTRDWARIDEVFSPDYVEHTPLPPGWPAGRDGVRSYFQEMTNAFPDVQATVEQVLADEGGEVAGRLTVRGTHLGNFMGIPATGKSLTWTESHFGRIVDGQVVEHWSDRDQFGLLQQLGVIPQLESAPTAAPTTDA